MDLAKKTDRIIIIILLVLAVLLPVRYIFRTTGIRHKQLETSGKEAGLTYEDYNGKKIGILTGTNIEKESFYYFPDSEYFYYDGYPNMNTALENGVIDAYLADEPALRCIHASRPGIDYLKDRLTNNSYSFAFRKDDPAEKKLRDQFNAFLKEIKEDGTYEAFFPLILTALIYFALSWLITKAVMLLTRAMDPRTHRKNEEFKRV